jgi:hypothetical protein
MPKVTYKKKDGNGNGAGGLGKMFRLFGKRTDPLMAELDEALAA